MTELPEPDRIETRGTGRFMPLPSVGDQIDLRELFRKIWRRRALIGGIVILMTTLAAIVSFQLTPRFRAAAFVMIQPSRSLVTSVEAASPVRPPELESINSEMAVIQSRRLAKRVVDRLKLNEDPEFNGAIMPKTFWSNLLDVRSLLPSTEQTLSEEEKAELEMSSVVSTFLTKGLFVSAKPFSWIIQISTESEDPRKAARLANTVVDLYMVEALEVKFEATKRATDWLSDRLGELKAQVEVSEKAVETYRKQAGLVGSMQVGLKEVSIVSQQLAELNSQVVLASSRRAEAEARLNQVKRLRDTRRGPESIAEVLASPIITRLLEQEGEVIRKAADLSEELGPKHPRMINTRAEVRDLRNKIGAEIEKVVHGLRSEVEVSRASERSLKSSLRKLESNIGLLNQKEVELRALERDAEANRVLYATFLSRFKQMTGQEDIQTPDARVVSYATLPVEASFPKKKLIVALVFGVSLMLSLVVIFAIEQLDAGFRSIEQVERLGGFPGLGLVPAIKNKKGGLAPEQLVVEEPLSAYSESIRNLHVSLVLSNVDKPPKVVLVTSSLPEEGKTVVSLSLARLVARSGQKVVVVDCDLRRPNVHRIVNLPRTPGLVELLAQQANLDEVMQVDESSGANVIASGEHARNSADLLSSDHMRQLLAQLSKSHDLVVLDSSPVLAVADSRVLTRLADKSMFVIRWEKTRREPALLGLRQIREAGGSIAGVVLTRVDVKRHAEYGFADSGSYHYRYQKYYTSS